MSKVLPFPPVTTPPPDADEHARRETERKRKLFAWADAVLRQLGYEQRMLLSATIEELRKITFDENAVEVMLAIRDALHPVDGQKAEHFAGVREGALKKIFKLRFTEMKKGREAELRIPRAGGDRRTSNWADDLILNIDGEIVANLTNLILILSKHPKWEGVLAYDEFNVRVVIRKRPPWGEEAPDAPWSDHHESLVRVWFQREDINPNHGDVGRAVQAASRANPFHPVREYFESIVWDGVPRLDTWLVTYFHAEDSEYIRAIGPRFLISAVARIYKPGCKVDHMLVLEGPQGKQKSAALDALADPWFTDRISHVGSKDACIEVAGVLLVEIAEMDALTRASASAIKSFLTRRHERYRPPYGKHPIKQPRQCVFAGSINPPVGGYLKDPTGARRFWPVACQGVIDREGLARDRDQLWAEAVIRFKAGDPWWLETSALEAPATAEQDARFIVDAWKEPIEKWLGRNQKEVSIREVLEGVFKLAPENWTQSAQNRVAAIGRENRYRR
jgi:putative DNA primase/helicase